MTAQVNAELPEQVSAEGKAQPKIEQTCRTCMETKLADGPFCTQFGGTMEVSETYSCSRWYPRNPEELREAQLNAMLADDELMEFMQRQ